MDNSTLHSKIHSLLENQKREVQDFVDFLLTKTKMEDEKKVRIFGSMKGKIEMVDDFDAPIEDFKDYM